MEQKLEEVTKENNEEAKEYFQFIKSSVADKSYFKDALDWYLFRYVSPVCDRTILIFGGIIAAVVCYFLIEMVQGMFPLVQRIPVFIRSFDQGEYYPDLIKLKPKSGTAGYDPMIETVDEAVLKHLVSVYVKEREGYDFRKGEIGDVNKKFTHIRNVSSLSEYKAFQSFMSKDNPSSPILNFGLNIAKSVEVDSVKFVKVESKDLTSKAKNFLMSVIPTDAEIRFSTVTKKVNSETNEASYDKEKYIAKIHFSFDGVKRKGDDDKKVLNFIVTEYKLFKVI
jgi:type IV secretory pathway component VirB8